MSGRTVRKALIALEACIAGMKTDPAYLVKWGRVTRAPLQDADWKHKYSVGIHDTTETVSHKTMGHWYRALNVVIEFRCTVEQNQIPSQEAGRIMAQIQRRVMENDTLGHVIINIQETGNELYVDFEDSRHVSGAIFMSMTYRHSESDPRTL